MKFSWKISIVCLLAASGCEKSSTIDSGGPISRYIHGNWTLVKIVTPSQVKTWSQIGYVETMISGNDQVKDYDQILHDGKSVALYTWSRAAPVVDADQTTIIMSYNEGVKRFFKIRQDPTQNTMEASAYLPEVNTPQDTVRYFYTQNK